MHIEEQGNLVHPFHRGGSLYLTSMNLWFAIGNWCEMGKVESFVLQWEGKEMGDAFAKLIRELRTKYRERLSSVSWAQVRNDMQAILS